MFPIIFVIDSKSSSNTFQKIFNFVDKHIVHLIILLSVFSLHITSILLTILKIIFGKNKNTGKIFSKHAIIYLLKYAFLVLVAFEIETSVNYLVTYFDEKKYDYEPLKDNFQILMDYLLAWWNPMIEKINEYIIIPGADSFSIAIIFVFILGLFKKIKTKDANILIYGGIFCKIMAITRIIRVISFSVVIIPNPKLNCYIDKFRVPESTEQMIWDFIKFRNAGCNDLIISGHTLFIWVSFKFINKIIG